MPQKPKYIIEPSDIEAVKPSDKISIDNVYAKPDHPDNHFTIKGKAIYQPEFSKDEEMFVFGKLAEIVAAATKYIPKVYRFSLKDSLRTADAQKAMEIAMREEYKGMVVPSNLVSGAGQGAHPKGMAIDIMLEKNIGDKWEEVSAGTRFDFFDVRVEEIEGKKTLVANDPPRSSRLYFHQNPHEDPSGEIRENQRILERAMMRSALEQGELLMPLEDEHWDFRFPNAPTSLEYTLKSIARIIGVTIPADKNIETKTFDDFKKLWKELFKGHEDKLEAELGVRNPPDKEPTYSNEYFPLMDRDLPKKIRITDGSYDRLALEHMATIHKKDHELGLGLYRPDTATKSFSGSVISEAGAGAARSV